MTLFLFPLNASAWWHRYHHPRGYHWHRGHWWRDDAIVAGLVAGALIAELPPHYQVVQAGPVPYYYDGTYYYQAAPGGYMVVTPPPGVIVVRR